jgi:uncharacterized membrane protein YeaQ/YmgE (transglycosylase-associated protein family)
MTMTYGAAIQLFIGFYIFGAICGYIIGRVAGTVLGFRLQRHILADIPYALCGALLGLLIYFWFYIASGQLAEDGRAEVIASATLGASVLIISIRCIQTVYARYTKRA